MTAGGGGVIVASRRLCCGARVGIVPHESAVITAFASLEQGAARMTGKRAARADPDPARLAAP